MLLLSKDFNEISIYDRTAFSTATIFFGNRFSQDLHAFGRDQNVVFNADAAEFAEFFHGGVIDERRPLFFRLAIDRSGRE